MSNHVGGKDFPGASIPEGAIDSTFGRLEPLITAEQLKSRHLFGIPLVSPVKNPITGKNDVITDEMLDDRILQAIAQAEADTSMVIADTEISEKQAYDKFQFQQLGYLQLRSRPVNRLQSIFVETANGDNIYQVPTDWVEMGNAVYGQLNFIPLNISTVGGGYIPAVSGSAGSALFLSILQGRFWVPGYWRVTYSAGFRDNKLPIVVNQLIGTIAAIEVLSMLAATYAKTTSTSLSIDSMSQSVSTPGPQLYAARLTELQDKRHSLIKKVKGIGGGLIIFGSV